MIDVPHVTIDNCRIGDDVYSYRKDDWGKINKIDRSGDVLPIEVDFPNSGFEYFTSNGRSSPHDRNPDLFYSRPAMTADGPPKRKVKRTWYMGVSEVLLENEAFGTTCVYPTEKHIQDIIKDDKNMSPWKIIPVEVNVEE